MRLSGLLVGLILFYVSPAFATKYTFSCRGGAVHPQTMTVDTARRTLRVESITNNTGRLCTTIVVDGRHSPVLSGPSADYCAVVLRGGGNPGARQSVKIKNDEVVANILTDDGQWGGFSLNLKTGIMQDLHGNVTKCQRAHDRRYTHTRPASRA